MTRCLQSAIDYARSGFPVTGRLAGWIEYARSDLAAHAESAAIYLDENPVIPLNVRN